MIKEKLKTVFDDGSTFTINLEYYNDAHSMAEDCQKRTNTSSKFYDMPHYSLKDWHGVDSYEEALDLLRNGYDDVMDAIKTATNRSYEQISKGKRYKSFNDVVGFQPIVPLVLMGVPTNMVNSSLAPIKVKVIDIYYDIVCSCGTKPKEILHNGEELLKCILGLEKQGYKLNLYVCNSYSDNSSADMLCVKIKDSNKPLDLKRISYPIAHPSFFRVLGFDWYGKFPPGKFRGGYGCALGYNLSEAKTTKIAKNIFGKNAVYINATEILNRNSDYIKDILMSKLSA